MPFRAKFALWVLTICWPALVLICLFSVWNRDVGQALFFGIMSGVFGIDLLKAWGREQSKGGS